MTRRERNASVFACAVDEFRETFQSRRGGRAAQAMMGVEDAEKSRRRWRGQLIFTEGHGLQLPSLALFDKDERLHWSNFKGLPVHSVCSQP
ncbi:hypothetical protein F2P81_025701 [Scophthalmus maximus]|uniref:Uncharacterized protein n=1 Tax=Scophthalmus maximus TaxID=52904 RepID=A0A6A4RHT9_SCOMX|nr:hypothetical protein F2P81_025701 [Scophthalmus maximus]